MELSEYFRLKHTYEGRLDQKKRQIRSDTSVGEREKRQKFEMIKRECVNCKKEGGTVFRVDKDKYYARCGATPPCTLDVQIQRQPVSSVHQQEQILENKASRIKNELIETNMDHVYKFTDEDNTLRRGDALRKDLQTTIDELVALRKGLERNVPQVSKLETLLQNEFAALRAADEGHADRYVTSVRPLVEQLREAKYKYAAVEQSEGGKHTLVQRTHTLDYFYR